MKFRIIIVFALVVVTILYFMPLPRGSSDRVSPVECEFIIYDPETEEVQVCLFVRTDGWYLDWSKHEVFIESRGFELEKRLEIRVPNGTLAYSEKHYLNATGILDFSWVNTSVDIEIINTDNNRMTGWSWGTVEEGRIVNNYTTEDDIDEGKALGYFGYECGTGMYSDLRSMVFSDAGICLSLFMGVVVLIALAWRYPHWFE